MKVLPKQKIIGVVVGLGFLIPSIAGIVSPVESAANYQLTLTAQSAIDQYRTLAIMVSVLGISICLGALKELTNRHTLILASLLVFSLLLGRLVSILMGSVTHLLLIEASVELVGLLLLIWALKSESA